MKIIVGSSNPTKIEAVRSVMSKYYPNCIVVGLEVESGVSPQPMSEEETLMGSRNRATAAAKQGDMGVGIEGGVTTVNGTMFECAWCTVVESESNRVGTGGGLYFELPKKIASRISKGEELGPIMQEIMKFDVKRTNGAIGVLTKNILTRQAAYEQIVASSLVKFVSPEWYD